MDEDFTGINNFDEYQRSKLTQRRNREIWTDAEPRPHKCPELVDSSFDQFFKHYPLFQISYTAIAVVMILFGQNEYSEVCEAVSVQYLLSVNTMMHLAVFMLYLSLRFDYYLKCHKTHKEWNSCLMLVAQTIIWLCSFVALTNLNKVKPEMDLDGNMV